MFRRTGGTGVPAFRLFRSGLSGFSREIDRAATGTQAA
jgi:hypothetical protein